jgi:hypothetical protein
MNTVILLLQFIIKIAPDITYLVNVKLIIVGYVYLRPLIYIVFITKRKC